MSDHTGVDGEGQGAPSGTGSQASPGTPTGSRPKGFDPSRMTWQPIATAPTDYTEVIGMDAQGTIARTWFFAPSSHTREWLRVGLPGRRKWNPIWWMPIPAPGGEAAQAAETCKGSAEGEHPVTEGEASDQIPAPMSEPAEQKIARLTRERDEMAAQAVACAQEADRIRVEIGAVQAENERLKAERDAAQAMVRQMSDAFITLTDGGPQFYIASEGGRVDAWGCVSYARDLHDRLRAALAESERKRVEAESLLALRTRQGTQAQETWARAAEQALSGDPRALHDKFARWRDPARLAAIVQSAAPTQETSHVES